MDSRLVLGEGELPVRDAQSQAFGDVVKAEDLLDENRAPAAVSMPVVTAAAMTLRLASRNGGCCTDPSATSRAIEVERSAVTQPRPPNSRS